MLRNALKSALLGAGVAGLLLAAGGASAKTKVEEPRNGHFSFEGPFGKFDQAALQRGYKVYAEVCSSCHAMNLLFYRNLGQPGGPFFDPKHPNPNDSPYAKAISADIKVPDIDPDTGDTIQRPATPADHFRAPFPNEAAARATNGGAYPPDLSVIAKAREGGANYIFSLLSGYAPPPKGLTVPAGKYYNPYFPGDLGSFWTGPKDQVPKGGFISMPFQLTPGRVTFDDGTKSTTEQQAHDVATFLAWASEPKQEERKQTGLAVMIYLFIFTGLAYGSYRRIWRNVAH
ncbi:cytochrome c1 [Caulobacter sp. S45]|jgi:ubiquinol-cytochrome c reductase cytochrome c1 subunit|uniref:cytochrome c1 n=1 Tax=Caulobacter sp. S45 TaxID=1641861 RepID=UPI00131D10E2|nr:cytochrome c1 [Caulobacter sp. S45]